MGEKKEKARVRATKENEGGFRKKCSGNELRANKGLQKKRTSVDQTPFIVHDQTERDNVVLFFLLSRDGEVEKVVPQD